MYLIKFKLKDYKYVFDIIVAFMIYLTILIG
jgi:hypothetical protein